MECKFADLTIEQVTYLVSADIDPIVVTYKKMREVEDVFDLCNKELDGFDLMAIRNSVVDTLGVLTSKAIERRNIELYEQLQANMSGITAVIDHVMMAKGC